MTAGAFSEHLDDCEALMSGWEEGPTDLMLCYYYCNGTVGGQALLSLTLCLFLTSPLLSLCSHISLYPCLTSSILNPDFSLTKHCQ